MLVVSCLSVPSAHHQGASLFTTLTSASCSTTQRHHRCQPSTRYSANRESSVRRTLLCNTPSKVSVYPLELVEPIYCSQVKNSTQLCFIWMVSHYSAEIPRLTISQLKTPGDSPGLAWSAASRPFGCTPSFSKTREASAEGGHARHLHPSCSMNKRYVLEQPFVVSEEHLWSQYAL